MIFVLANVKNVGIRLYVGFLLTIKKQYDKIINIEKMQIIILQGGKNMEKQSKILEIDPYLTPYEKEISLRKEKFYNKLKQLKKG